MAHLLALGLICLAVWTVVALPLGVLVGRRLRAVRRSTSSNRPTTGSTR